MSIVKENASLHIVLIDDSKHDRIAFRRAFRGNCVPVQITEYMRAEEALEVLRKTTAGIDLVVTDYKLPGMTGLALCEELLKHHLPLPLVVLSVSATRWGDRSTDAVDLPAQPDPVGSDPHRRVHAVCCRR